MRDASVDGQAKQGGGDVIHPAGLFLLGLAGLALLLLLAESLLRRHGTEGPGAHRGEFHLHFLHFMKKMERLLSIHAGACEHIVEVTLVLFDSGNDLKIQSIHCLRVEGDKNVCLGKRRGGVLCARAGR